MTNWYLLNKEPKEISYYRPGPDIDSGMKDENGNPIMMPGDMKLIEKTAEPGTVFNCIVYDGVSPFTPPSDMDLKSSEEQFGIGDVFEDDSAA